MVDGGKHGHGRVHRQGPGAAAHLAEDGAEALQSGDLYDAWSGIMSLLRVRKADPGEVKAAVDKAALGLVATRLEKSNKAGGETKSTWFGSRNDQYSARWHPLRVLVAGRVHVRCDASIGWGHVVCHCGVQTGFKFAEGGGVVPLNSKKDTELARLLRSLSRLTPLEWLRANGLEGVNRLLVGALMCMNFGKQSGMQTDERV